MKETVQRCSICKSEKCDGREFRVSGSYSRGCKITIDKIVCSNEVTRKECAYWYRLICGHGDWEDFKAIPL
jgi:hypothetical protein